MSQTYGSQVFGPMYDVVVPVIMAVAFIYFGVRARGMTADERAKLPLFIGMTAARRFLRKKRTRRQPPLHARVTKRSMPPKPTVGENDRCEKESENNEIRRIQRCALCRACICLQPASSVRRRKSVAVIGRPCRERTDSDGDRRKQMRRPRRAAGPVYPLKASASGR